MKVQIKKWIKKKKWDMGGMNEQVGKTNDTRNSGNSVNRK